MIKSKIIMGDFSDYYELIRLSRIVDYYINYYEVINIYSKCSRGGVQADMVIITYKDKENK